MTTNPSLPEVVAIELNQALAGFDATKNSLSALVEAFSADINARLDLLSSYIGATPVTTYGKNLVDINNTMPVIEGVRYNATTTVASTANFIAITPVPIRAELLGQTVVGSGADFTGVQGFFVDENDNFLESVVWENTVPNSVPSKQMTIPNIPEIAAMKINAVLRTAPHDYEFQLELLPETGLASAYEDYQNPVTNVEVNIPDSQSVYRLTDGLGNIFDEGSETVARDINNNPISPNCPYQFLIDSTGNSSVMPFEFFPPSDVVGIFIYGQSNGVGPAYDGTLVDDIPLTGRAMMFEGGIKVGALNKTQDFTKFACARETAAFVDVVGVTRGSTGMMEFTKGWLRRGRAGRLLVASMAHGGQSRTFFEPNSSSGSRHFEEVFEPMVDGIVAHADQQGKEFKLLIMPARQGEANQFGTNTRDSWKTGTAANLAAYDASVKLKTGQSEDIRMITYQTSHFTLEDYTDGTLTTLDRAASLGQLDFAAENPNVYMSIPMYQLPHGDDIHADKFGMQQLGRVEDYIAGRILSGDTRKNHIDFERQGTVSGNTLTLKSRGWHTSPIWFDRQTLDATFQDGWHIDDGGDPVTITSINVRTIEDIDYLDFVCNRNLQAGNGLASYAMHYRAPISNGGPSIATGNMRDSTTEVVRFAPHNEITF